MIDDEQLASHLLEAALIDRDGLQAAKRLQSSSGASLYDTLARHRLVEESKLVGVVAELLNVSAIRIDGATIDDAVLALVPVSMATRNRVIPLHLQEEDGREQLVLGMADPIDVLAMDEIATHTGIDIHPVLVAPTQLARALDRFYGQAGMVDADALFADFDIDLDELQVGGEDSWAQYFDPAAQKAAGSAEPSKQPPGPPRGAQVDFEESAIISQEMRDRPSTDVLAVDEFGEIDVVDESQLDAPLDEAFTPNASPREIDLDDWEIDEAIGTSPEAQILSKHDAEELFATGGPRGGGLESVTEEVEGAYGKADGDASRAGVAEAPRRVEGVSEDSAVSCEDDSEPRLSARDDAAPAGLVAKTPAGAEPNTRELDASNLLELAESAREEHGQGRGKFGVHHRETAQHRALPSDARAVRPTPGSAGAPGDRLSSLPTEALLHAALSMLIEHGLLDPDELHTRALGQGGQRGEGSGSSGD